MMNLPQPPSNYVQGLEAQRNRALEQADQENYKRNSDLELGANRLILRSANGVRWQVVVSNTGALTLQAISGGTQYGPYAGVSGEPTYSGTAGTLVINSEPVPGGHIGWVCLGGSQWRRVGIIDLMVDSGAGVPVATAVFPKCATCPAAAGIPGDLVICSAPIAGGHAGWVYVGGSGWYRFGPLDLASDPGAAAPVAGPGYALASAAPNTSGAAGDIVLFSGPFGGSHAGWICLGGTTWHRWGVLEL